MSYLRDETGRSVTQSAQWRGGKEEAAPAAVAVDVKYPQVTISPRKTFL